MPVGGDRGTFDGWSSTSRSGARPDLDLSEIISAYQEWLDGGDPTTAGYHFDYTGQKIASDAADWDVPRKAHPMSVDDPILFGNGPATCSTSTALARALEICWDVNGYYRSLGVHWKATRKELRLAYQRINGQESRYLTYVLKQLLNEEKRATYDRMPLGEQFLDDKYVQEALKRMAAKKAQERSEQGVPTTASDVLDEMGYDLHLDPQGGEDSPEEVLDDDRSKRSNVSDPGSTLDSWAFSYYLWRSADIAEHARLARWQELLVSAMSRKGVVIQLAVGIFGKQDHRFVTAVVDGNRVIMLNEQNLEPDDELAEAAVEAVLREL